MIFENIENTLQSQSSQYLWTDNITFLKNQEDILKSAASDSPFLACWKIFEIYNPS